MRTLLLILMLPVIGFAQSPIKNLVFEGGGIRGIAYCGALEHFEKSGQFEQVERVAGTSAGAITAAFLAVGYSPEEISDIIYYTDFGDFNDGKYSVAGGAVRMVEGYGWYMGDAFVGWLESHISKKTRDKDITFGELHDGKADKGYYDLYTTGTDLTLQKPEVFSFENYPNMRIVDAVRISMSVPFWYMAIGIDEEGSIVEHDDWETSTRIFVDGGLVMNYPITIFDEYRYYSGASVAAFQDDFKNPQTLGFRLDSQEQITHDQDQTGLAPQAIEGIDDFTVALYVMVIENLNRQKLDNADWARTVSINTVEIGPRVKKLSDTQKNELISSGRAASSFYLEKSSVMD
jgi:NTE family protein